MTAITFDTSRRVKRLKDAGFTEIQAKAVAGMIQDSGEVDLSRLTPRERTERLEAKADARFSHIESAMATKDQVERLEAKTESRCSRIETTMATKGQVERLEAKTESRCSRIETAMTYTFATKAELTESNAKTFKLIMEITLFAAAIFNFLVILGGMYGLAKLLGH